MENLSFEELKEIANNPYTTSSVLSELAKHSDSQIRLLVASNPNTSIDDLMKLGEEFPEAIVENPVFDLLKLEQGNSRFTRLSLARSRKTKPEVLTQLVANEYEDEEICLAVAGNINTPVETLKSLIGWTHIYDDSGEPPMSITKKVINNPSMPISILENIEDDYDWWDFHEWKQEISKLSNLSEIIIDKLTVDEWSTEKYGIHIIDNPTVQKSPKILDRLARHYCILTNHEYINGIYKYEYIDRPFFKVLKNPLLSPSTLEYVASHFFPYVRNLIIDHPNVTQKALDIILFMQGKEGTPIEILNELADNCLSSQFDYYGKNTLNILKKLVTYPDTSSEILDKIIDTIYKKNSKFKEKNKFLLYGLNHPNISLDTFNKLVETLPPFAMYFYTFLFDKSTQNRYDYFKKTKIINRNKPKQIDRYSRENLYEVISQIRIRWLENVPEEYLIKHHHQLLPEYQQPPNTLVFIFFWCNLSLDGTNLHPEQQEKDLLLKQFRYLSDRLYHICHQRDITIEAICPKSGLPLYSKSGTDSFDINTIVTRYLPQFKQEKGSCGLIHPEWGKAVYPCLILSWVEKVKIKAILLSMINKYDRLLLCDA